MGWHLRLWDGNKGKIFGKIFWHVLIHTAAENWGCCEIRYVQICNRGANARCSYVTVTTLQWSPYSHRSCVTVDFSHDQKGESVVDQAAVTISAPTQQQTVPRNPPPRYGHCYAPCSVYHTPASLQVFQNKSRSDISTVCLSMLIIMSNKSIKWKRTSFHSHILQRRM